jgi:hypothetical protein
MWSALEIFKKVPKVNCRTMGDNTPNLVTLIRELEKKGVGGGAEVDAGRRTSREKAEHQNVYYILPTLCLFREIKKAGVNVVNKRSFWGTENIIFCTSYIKNLF